MSLDPVTALLDIGGKVIDKLWPDPIQAANAKLELYKAQQAGDFKEQENLLAVNLAQIKVNEVEAANPSLLVSGARPFILWVCGIALAYVSIIEPVARFIATVLYKYVGVFPVIDTTITLQVLLGLLGLGAMRSVDKKNGVASK